MIQLTVVHKLQEVFKIKNIKEEDEKTEDVDYYPIKSTRNTNPIHTQVQSYQEAADI